MAVGSFQVDQFIEDFGLHHSVDCLNSLIKPQLIELVRSLGLSVKTSTICVNRAGR